MRMTLTNRSRALLTLELNTGRWIHLAPGETSGRLEDYEVRDNRYVRRLSARKVLALSSVAEPEGELANPKAASTAPRATKKYGTPRA